MDPSNIISGVVNKIKGGASSGGGAPEGDIAAVSGDERVAREDLFAIKEKLRKEVDQIQKIMLEANSSTKMLKSLEGVHLAELISQMTTLHHLCDTKFREQMQNISDNIETGNLDAAENWLHFLKNQMYEHAELMDPAKFEQDVVALQAEKDKVELSINNILYDLKLTQKMLTDIQSSVTRFETEFYKMKEGMK